MIATNKKILVTGAIFVDIIVGLTRLPKTGEDITGQMKSVKVGGSAYNVQSAIAYLKGNSDLFAPIGKGPYADIIRHEFKRRNFTQSLIDERADNGWDISFIEKDGERTFLTVQGIEQMYQRRWFSQVNLHDYDYIYVSGYELENDQSAIILLDELGKRKRDAKVLFDASPRLAYISESLIKRLLRPGTIVHCNEAEANILAHTTDSYALAAKKIFDMTQEPVVITLGSAGTFFLTYNDQALIPAEHIPIINTIGAGDSHCGAFLAGLSSGMSIRESIKQANHVSALVVNQESGALE